MHGTRDLDHVVSRIHMIWRHVRKKDVPGYMVSATWFHMIAEYELGLERIHQVTNTIRIAIQGGEYDTYREYTFSQRLN